ncbi:MAG TPA: GNAT family N-acetyltransferase [Candidatus Thermoplasmatota archaeon]|nr:GNAT family N-acetyltransferase [Candidatus Thermoplasmatota archaeon]
MAVRPARPSDLEPLVAATLGMAKDSEGLVLDPEEARRGVAAVLKDSGKGAFFVLEEGGRVVASLFVTFEWSDWHDAWYWWLQSVHVVPGRRGEGLFRRLYEGVREAARRQGDVRSVRLYVEGHNEAGLRAYRGLGMKETEYRVFDHPL